MKSGIYSITSPSGRRYIGSAVDIEDRRQLAAFMHTPEAKAKKAIAMKGHAVSKVAREKISAANLGRRRTSTQIANIKAGIALARATALTLQNGA